MDSNIKLARLTGALYLIVILCAGFSQGYVRAGLIVPGDAAATADNIMASEWLFRLGFVSDLIAFLCDAAIAVLFYVLLKSAGKTLSLMAASFRLLAHPAIASINLLNHFAAILLLGGAGYLTFFDPAELQALAMLALDAHGYGYLIGGAFFGVHCLLLGYLLVKSTLFPRLLGRLMMIAGVGYLVESFGKFLFPAYAEAFTWAVAVPAAVAEISLAVWLLWKGVKIKN